MLWFSLSFSRLCSVPAVLLSKGLPLSTPCFGGEEPLGPYSRWGFLPSFCPGFRCRDKERAVAFQELPPPCPVARVLRQGGERVFYPPPQVLWVGSRGLWSPSVLGRVKMKVLVIIFTLLPLPHLQVYILNWLFTVEQDRNSPYGVVWVEGAAARVLVLLCSLSVSSVTLFQRDFSPGCGGGWRFSFPSCSSVT